MLFREGSGAHSFYVLLKGRLGHSSGTAGNRHEVVAPTHKNEGVCFGTEGLTGKIRRLTTVTALDECTLLRFSTHGMRIDEDGLAGLARRASNNVIAQVRLT